MSSLQVVLAVMVPVWTLSVLANLAVARPRLRPVAIGAALVFYGLLALGALTAVAVVMLGAAGASGAPGVLTLLQRLASAVPVAAACVAVGALAAALSLHPVVRRRAARLLPLDPDAIVDAMALSLALCGLGLGSANIALTSVAFDMLESGRVSVASDVATSLATNALVILPAALLGVGVFIRRRPLDALRRLGFTRTNWWAVAFAPLVAIAMFMAAILVSVVWTAVDPASAARITRLNEAVMGDFTALGIAGSFLIAGVAALTEETLFRGALQPKLGIVLPTLLFAVMHAQYLFSPATLLIFVLGFALALTRRFSGNIYTPMATHFLYNFIISALAVVMRSLPRP